MNIFARQKFISLNGKITKIKNSQSSNQIQDHVCVIRDLMRKPDSKHSCSDYLTKDSQSFKITLPLDF